jgi:outer membrane biosynthesis protein TonB
MSVTIDDLRGIRDPGGLSRVLSWSFGVHLAAVVLLVLAPKFGWIKPRQPDKIMVIDLGGVPDAKPGPTTIGGRPVDQAVPEPKRPEIIQPAAQKQDVMPIPTKTAPPPKTPPKAPPKQEQPKTPIPTKQPVTTGRAVTTGSTRAETGVTGMSSGLQIGGGVGNINSLDEFCCKAYLGDIENRIKRLVDFAQQERGKVIVRFTIQRNGSVTDVQIDQPATPLLNMASQRPFVRLQLPPLPPEFTGPWLTLRLTLEYK